MQFKNVIGQDGVKQHLVEMVQHNRLSHALLFLGKEGSGALPLAMAFAQYIASLPPASSGGEGAANAQEVSLFGETAIEVEVKLPATPEEADAYMSRQSSFSKAEGMVHPDIHYTYPVVTKKAGSPPVSADYITEWREFVQTYPYGNIYDWLQFIGAENKQGNITAQECNEIMRQLSLKSFESGYKILILWMPEYLGKEGNKLLKLIEEPPADTLFILVGENEGQILSTIVSRCQLIKIPALEPSAIEKALIQRNNCKPEQAHQVAGVCEGNYREALHLLQHADEDFHGLLREWLNATLKGQIIAQVKFIEEINRLGRETQKQFLRYFTHLLEQSIRLDSLEENAKDFFYNSLAATEQDFIGRLNKMLSLEQKEVIAEELNKATYYVERNANGKLLFHALTIKIFHIVKNNVLISA
jgi:DNA polymerase III subunit delta'